ncbi:MAG TPA: DUF1990 family protein [Chloroflexota bacterium]|nr:DUF1990 family protein [Chloroflexota bacterium]
MARGLTAKWRIGRSWSERQLLEYLQQLPDRRINFTDTPEPTAQGSDWTVDGVQDTIGSEADGPPAADGIFARARQALINYDFSDPRIVVGHFDPRTPLHGRNMLLEIKVFGLHFLGGVRVQEVMGETGSHETRFGYRYDTLEGHFERGFEWFVLTKDHATGEVRFSIEAHWQVGDFPTWWSRIGFALVGERFRKIWRLRAVERVRRLATQPEEKPLASPETLAHRGDSRPTRTAR